MKVRTLLVSLTSLAGLLLWSGCQSTPTTATPSAPASAPSAKAPKLPGHIRALETALDRYVATPDTNYVWKLVQSQKTKGATVDSIALTSQSWLTTNEVNRTVWKHWLTIVRPDNVKHSTALLFIGGGSNRDDKPPKPNDQLVGVAIAAQSVVAELKMVPNQPLIFGNDGRERVEDDLIAYTWDKFLRTGDERWPARLPMTKSAVRAMDAISAHTASAEGGKISVDKFVVAGGSKRGWTTWTTGIVDDRVTAICPIVIDVLNVTPSMHHHYQAYGFFAPAVSEYQDAYIFDRVDAPRFKQLMRIEDPFEYRDRLQMPKLILNSAGDQFFVPDSSQFYFQQLPGAKYLRYVPNSDHSMRGTDAFETLLAWHHAHLNHTPLPEIQWKREPNGVLKAHSKHPAKAVKLWQAHNPIARDFRLMTLGPVWRDTDLNEDAKAKGWFTATVPAPSSGWSAYFIEFTFDVGAPTPLKITTDVVVTPDRYASPRFQPRPVP